MRTLLLALLMTATALTGCTDDGSPDPDSDVAVGNAMDAEIEASIEESPAILYEAVNPWDDGQGGNHSEILLLDDAFYSDPTYDWSVPPGGYAGGIYTGLPTGMLLPPGTKEVRFEVDVSSTERNGMWGPYIYYTAAGYVYESGNRSVEGEPTADATATWTFPIRPVDWDPVYATESEFWLGVYPYGDPSFNTMEGDVHVKVTAIRDPDWTPEPIYDPWPDLDPERMPQEGVFTLGEGTLTWTETEGQWALTAQGGKSLDLDFLVPLGTEHVVWGAAWSMPDCPPTASCTGGVNLRHGDFYSEAYAFVEPSDYDIDRYIAAAVDVPEDITPYVDINASVVGAFILVYLMSCDQADATCPTPNVGTAEVVVRAEAWRGEVDMDAFKARLGVT